MPVWYTLFEVLTCTYAYTIHILFILVLVCIGYTFHSELFEEMVGKTLGGALNEQISKAKEKPTEKHTHKNMQTKL